MAQKCNPEPAAWGASPDERILVDMLHSTSLSPYQVSVLIGVWTLLKLSGFSSGLVNLWSSLLGMIKCEMPPKLGQ